MKNKFTLFISCIFLLIINAYSITLQANNDEFADVGLKLSIWAQENGKITTNDQTSTNFSIENARLYLIGQINHHIQFGTNIDFSDNNLTNPDGSARAHDKMKYTIVKDAFINFKVKKYFQITTGLFLDPWSRIPLEDLYSFIVPLEDYNPGVSEINVDGDRLLASPNQPNLNYIYHEKKNLYEFKPFIKPIVPLTFGSDVGNAFRDTGIAIWGDIAKHTMLKYYLIVGNGRYDYQSGYNSNSHLKYGFRLEFTPTFLGYKGMPDYVDKDTFLGKRKTLTFSIAYQQQALDCSDISTNPICDGVSQSTTARAYTFDILWEQKFRNIVPNIQLAYMNQKNLGFSKTQDNIISNPESIGYYIQTQLLYDKFIGIGKPAIVLRYEEDENKNYYLNPSNENSFINAKIGMYDIFLNYYIDGELANVSIGAQVVNPNANTIYATSNGSNTLKAFTDYSLIFRTVF